MNIRTAALATLFVYIFSCDSDFAFESDFDNSLDVWNSSKKKSNSYNFTVSTGSIFGFGSQTTITVKNGKVVSRGHEAFLNETQTTEAQITARWSEDIANLNTHQEGAKALTLDEVYSSCQKVILSVNEDYNFIFYAAENDGLLSLCTYFPKNCQDDCDIGFNITSISWLNK